MKDKIAELLTDEGGEIYEGYSGRGMYGKETTGVSFESKSEFERALIGAAFELGRNHQDANVEEMLRDLNNLGSDSLGMGIIVY